MASDEVKAWLPATESLMLERLGLAGPGKGRNPNAFRRWVRSCTTKPISEWPGAQWVVDKWNRTPAALVPAEWEGTRAAVRWQGSGLLLVSADEAARMIREHTEGAHGKA